MKNAITLARVHTHTHTHTSDLLNKEIRLKLNIKENKKIANNLKLEKSLG